MVRLLTHAVLVVIVTAALGVGGLAAAKRMRTGSWSLPAKEDYAWLQRAIAKPAGPPRTVYLSRDRITVAGGIDDAHELRTQLIPQGIRRELPGYTGSKRSWNRIVACVRSKLSAYNIQIVDKRPRDRGYIMVHVGGRPRDLFGRDRKNMGGVAPYNGRVIRDAMAFVFSQTLRNRRPEICESIAHEIGHTYGLDHSYRCGDLMTYIQGCRNRRFVDAHVRCGESNRRDCENGAVTQNSHEHLLAVLGTRKREASKPAPARRVEQPAGSMARRAH